LLVLLLLLLIRSRNSQLGRAFGPDVVLESRLSRIHDRGRVATGELESSAAAAADDTESADSFEELNEIRSRNSQLGRAFGPDVVLESRLSRISSSGDGLLPSTTPRKRVTRSSTRGSSPPGSGMVVRGANANGASRAKKRATPPCSKWR
jgi:hypothetical protein